MHAPDRTEKFAMMKTTLKDIQQTKSTQSIKFKRIFFLPLETTKKNETQRENTKNLEIKKKKREREIQKKSLGGTGSEALQ